MPAEMPRLPPFPSNSLLYSWKNLRVFPVPVGPFSRGQISEFLRKVHQGPQEPNEVIFPDLGVNEVRYHCAKRPTY